MLPSTGKISMVDVWRELNPPMDPKDCDYYFETREDFDARRDQILDENNNDLSQKTFGFGDLVTNLNSAFEYTEITATPKMIVAKNVTYFGYCFSSCYMLKNISKDLFKNCHNSATFHKCFNFCTSLSSIPQGLFDKNINATDFVNCFYDCNSLASIPKGLFDNCPNVTDFGGCFYNCSSLTSIPQGLFDKNINATNFCQCFYSCSSLTLIPQGLFDNCSNVTDFVECFYDCSITSIPQGLFDKCHNVTSFSHCFGSCMSLKTIPQGLFDKNINVTSFSDCFETCESLSSIPFKLFDNCTNATNFSNCFIFCTNITSTLPDVWNKSKFPKVTNGTDYALDCTKAANYNEIPSNFGGPDTNPAVPLSIKEQIEEPINKQIVINKSTEKIVDDRLPDGPIALGDTDVRKLAGKQIKPIFKFTNESSAKYRIESKHGNDDFSDTEIGDKFTIRYNAPIGGDITLANDVYNNNVFLSSIVVNEFQYKFDFDVTNITNDIFVCNQGKTPSFSNDLQSPSSTIGLNDLHGKPIQLVLTINCSDFGGPLGCDANIKKISSNQGHNINIDDLYYKIIQVKFAPNCKFNIEMYGKSAGMPNASNLVYADDKGRETVISYGSGTIIKELGPLNNSASIKFYSTH